MAPDSENRSVCALFEGFVAYALFRMMTSSHQALRSMLCRGNGVTHQTYLHV